MADAENKFKFRVDEATRFQIQRDLILMAATSGWLTSALLVAAFGVFTWTSYREGKYVGAAIVALGGTCSFLMRLAMRVYSNRSALETQEMLEVGKRLLVASAVISGTTWAYATLWIYPHL